MGHIHIDKEECDNCGKTVDQLEASGYLEVKTLVVGPIEGKMPPDIGGVFCGPECTSEGMLKARQAIRAGKFRDETVQQFLLRKREEKMKELMKSVQTEAATTEDIPLGQYI